MNGYDYMYDDNRTMDEVAVERFLEWLHFEKNIHLCYRRANEEYEWSGLTIPRVLREYYGR